MNFMFEWQEQYLTSERTREILLFYYMACVCSRYNARSDWLIETEL